MALLGHISGCKVGWNLWSTEAEALEDSKKQAVERERKFELGYDFGYQWPGAVQHVEDHHEHGEHWSVVTV